ncbi:conserved hypothetical protein [Talaromyces stipitatus ATCC 10500]|uniref:Mitotic apparatus protein p62 n=1 Tax=Talaromyces stipitatus (strain ATCC 10500 / CBS 375.48 / QM 6759 / NRRL 1006) TaxID=441959 RepID=B8MIH7_TALSN|nr:uncharacterized protein TSTA_045310 [Talaromyces stipitatus ATCC 10500]EED15069.1 conserved hypothetical protein [Talaromyces stipitatus ATCC 10500]
MPAENKDWVIRIPRSDNTNEFVLIYIAPTGKAALDLRFIATEGENPYVGSLRQSRLKDIRSKNFQGTEQELEQILKSVLRVRNVSYEPKQESEIEATASIKSTKEEVNELVITIRKKIDSITQRVASLTLTQNDDQTIELFEWMGLILSRTDVYEHQISTLTTHLQVAQKSIKDLQTSLDDLVKSRKEHENMLLGSFAQVLNEKKLKIRNQQRLLASAIVDSDKVRELESMDQEKPAPKTRRNKRKAPIRQQESDSDDGFEKMDIDKPKPSRRGATKNQAEDQQDVAEEEDEEDEDEELRPETPQPLEEETESEAEEERMASPPDEEKREENKSTRPNLTRAADPPPPPRRDLPFARRGKGAADTSSKEAEKAAEQHGGDDDATGGETDDDEL